MTSCLLFLSLRTLLTLLNESLATPSRSSPLLRVPALYVACGGLVACGRTKGASRHIFLTS
jgi:hypothetical protein